jgi:hypothetical protein
VVWCLGAAARGSVLAGEGVDGGGGEVPKLWGGKGEVRAASIGEGRASEGALIGKGWTVALRRESAVGRATLMPEGWASSMNEEGVVCLGLDEGVGKEEKGAPAAP